MMEDAELLRCYVEECSEKAFAELVERHLKWVYPLALRLVGGDRHLAQDVAQSVFTDLAIKARGLTRHRILAGWLYTSTRYAAAQLVRSERRRVARDQLAYEMTEMSTPDHPKEGESIAPVVDEVLPLLKPRDREALLLRFFEGKTFAELGATLSLSADAARMRVERALEKTQALLLKRGVTSTATALAGVLGTHSSWAAPAGWAAAISSTALATAAAATSASSVSAIAFMTLSKTKFIILTTLLAGGAATLVIQHHTNQELRRELSVAQARPVPDPAAVSRPIAVDTPASAVNKPTPSSGEVGSRAVPVRENPPSEPETGTNPGSEGVASQLRPIETLVDAGQGSPRAAFETQLWAAHGGDVEREAKTLVLGPKARAKMEALMPTLPASLRSEYTTPEQVMAYVLAGSPRPISAVQVLSETRQDADTVILHAAWRHEGSAEVITNDVRFQRSPDGWRLVIPPSLVDRAANYLNNTPLPRPKAPGS